jgi:LacI family transcriptional regulator
MPPNVRIGLIFDHINDYCRDVLFGIKRYITTKPHWVAFLIVAETSRLRTLRRRRLDGLIAHVFKPSLYRALRPLRKPIVNVSSILDLPLPRVAADEEAAGVAAAEHFLERGFRNFGCVSNRHFAYAVKAEASFCRVVEAGGLSVHRFYDPLMHIYHVRGALWGSDKRVHAWLRSLPKPVAIFASEDVWGYELTEACQHIGLRIPDDIALLGFDNDSLLCELAQPSLSSIAVPGKQIGYEAAALLDRLLCGAPPPKCPLLLPPLGVVTRQSSDLLAVDDPELVTALRYIRDHCHLPIGVVDVLRVVPTPRRSLERRFRQTLARGIFEEIRRVRLERAKTLLASTRLSIADVAREAGFASNKHLSVTFREELDLSPTDYRRQF